MYFKNMILMGDPNIRLSDITQTLNNLNSSLLSGRDDSQVNFPFLHVHPDQRSLFGTNARSDETFDHIAFFIDRNGRHLPSTGDNRQAGQQGLNDYDFGVFNFVELISQAIHNLSFHELTKAQQKSLVKNTKADISDHLPIWVRLPISGA